MYVATSHWFLHTIDISQIKCIFDLLGTPSDVELQHLGSQEASIFVKSLPKRTPIPLDQLFPGANPLALDLIQRMLAFDPKLRISAEQALLHPYVHDFASKYGTEEQSATHAGQILLQDDSHMTNAITKRLYFFFAKIFFRIIVPRGTLIQ